MNDNFKQEADREIVSNASKHNTDREILQEKIITRIIDIVFILIAVGMGAFFIWAFVNHFDLGFIR